MSKNELKLETLAVHAGQKVDPIEKSRGISVHRTTSYLFDNAQYARDLFALKIPGNIYTRLQNPTHDVLEKRVAAMEQSPAALAVASGTNAIFYSIITICKHGNNIVSANNLYGGTYTLFSTILPQFGITTHFVKPNDFEGYEKSIDSNTRAIYVEAIGNPTLDVVDLEKVSAIAKKYRLPLIVDSTFTTPYLLNPAKHGADVVVHSLSKWIGGHGSAIGGIVVDSGTFDWSDSKFDLFNEPDLNYHGIVWTRDLPEELAKSPFVVRMRTVYLRNLGGAISPDNAWIFIQGLESLAVRMDRHCENALKVAQYLSNHPKVSWVRYPGLKKDPSFDIASKYLKKGFGGMVVFGIKGGVQAGEAFIDHLKLFSHLANVGDTKSLALHPGSTSHSQMSEAEQEESGLTQDLVRLSIGIENIEDILADIDQALQSI